ncbi:ROK family protein [Patescibacteria group bacterium]|nr:ROK family protein [Patescibacteria group bacterium]
MVEQEVIGVDAGATWIKGARYSAELELLQEIKQASAAAEGSVAYFDAIAEVVAALAPEGGVPVGLSLPALLSRDSKTILAMANVTDLQTGDQPQVVKDIFTERWNTAQFVVQNDAHCAALAEWKLGWGSGEVSRSLLHLTWGTGIGVGFVVEGLVQYGWEAGHLPVSWEAADWRCGCGSTVDLEALIAVPRLVEQARAAVTAGIVATKITLPELADIREAPKLLSQRASSGDALAQQILGEALTWMARGLLGMSVISFPDRVTIGGAMMASDWLLETLREAIEANRQGFVSRALEARQVQRAKLGNEAGRVGAAWLALQAFSR